MSATVGFRVSLWMGRINRLVGLLLALIMTISIQAGAQVPGAAARPQSAYSLTIATATPGGTFYRVGYAIAALVTEDLGTDNVSMTAINTDGSKENVKLLLDGQVQFALLQGFIGARVAEGAFDLDAEAVQQHLRAVAPVWLNVEHFVVLREAVVNGSGTIDDLKSLRRTGIGARPGAPPRFSLGKGESGTRLSGLHILEAIGLMPNEVFELDGLSYSESAERLIEGRIEGMNTPAGVPVAAVGKAFQERGADIVVLSFEEKHLADVNKTLRSGHDLWSIYSIEAGTYSVEQDKAIQTIAQPNFLAVREDLDAEVVCKITALIFDNQGFFEKVHRSTEYMFTEAQSRPEAASRLPFPLHEGAALYYANRDAHEPCASTIDRSPES